ncbi:N-acetyltransferase [Janthinobacterium sp. 17J80-10]|uniref:N-acetyltransferase n=1 Tax=Janthinobacterium sp. 17J80-10 TaxID=2497863 RepID=UPI00100531D2|nr:N-acetyltransferase [Janthinobacterium sp. 17J80-10]QAU32706.1 N-acetyltransferase [Janthinobacterium sp. 17J80-10]
MPLSPLPWLARALELRIDVAAPSGLEQELETLYRRLHRPGDALYGLPVICLNFPGFVFRYREADGEHYIYVEDAARQCLAGYTVLNRLVEVHRRADPYLRAPHSKYAPAYQRRGIATAIYRWWLEAGNCLITGARQSVGANALWHSLAKRYELLYVDLRSKSMRALGRHVDQATQEDLHTRMLLLGNGWHLDRLAACTGMLLHAGDLEDARGIRGRMRAH